MAATWKQSITTSAGIALMNKAYGVSSIIPTKAVTITDDISGYSVTQVMALTSVKYNQSRVPIVIINQANTTRIGIDIDNKDVNEQYDYYGIGVYFKQVNTGEEVLFSVIPLSGAATIIPNQSGVATSSISIDSYTSIVPGTNVDLTVSDSGSVTRGDVEKIVAANQSLSFPKKPLATGIDLQSTKSIGIYQINDDKTVVNAPDGFSGNGYLIVVGDGTTANPITQDLFDTVTGNKYSNSYDSDGNKWTGWKEMASKSDVTDLNNGLSTKVTDNGNGTIQVNGTQVSPYNKLTDSVGGRNLLINTAQLNDSTVCLDRTSNISDTYLGLNIYQANAPWKGVRIYLPYLASKIKTNTDYVMSEYLRNTSPTTPVKIGVFGDDEGNDAGVVFNSKIGYSITLPPNSGWTRISAPVNIASFPTNVIGALRFENTTTLTDGYVQFAGLKLEQGSVATDWTPAPEDKVNVSDMRKPASDVAGIEEVNAKQDKLTITPADDSKVAHLSGANNFDTVPTVNNNPLLLASSLPSDLARLSQDANFTAKLQQNGQDVALANNTIARNPNTGVVSKPTDFTNLTVNGGKSVATSDDLKSLEASAWRELNFDVSQGNYKAFSAAKIVYKINRDEKYISFFFAGTPSHVGNTSSNSTLVTDTTSLVMDLSSVLTEISGINFKADYGQIGDSISHAASLGYAGSKVVFTSQVFIENYLVGVTFLPKDYPDCRIYYTSLVNGI